MGRPLSQCSGRADTLVPMSFTRPYELFLRVFEPLAAHPRWQGGATDANRDRIESALRKDADDRLIVLPPAPMPPATPSMRMLLPASQTADGIDRVWPVQQDVLSWGAIRELEESVPTSLLDPLVPRSVRREASMERMDWLRRENGDLMYAQVSSWQVPFQWWLAFDETVDQVIEEEADDGSVRIRVRAEIMSASARADWARDVLAESTPAGGPAAVAAEFAEWLDSFDFNSILELDLGGMSAFHWESDMRHRLEESLDALADSDVDRATEAFAAYMHTLDSERLLARVN